MLTHYFHPAHISNIDISSANTQFFRGEISTRKSAGAPGQSGDIRFAGHVSPVL
jgi:hypothetical protein